MLRGHAAQRLRRIERWLRAERRCPAASYPQLRVSLEHQTEHGEAVGDRPVAGMLSGVGLAGQRALGGELGRQGR